MAKVEKVVIGKKYNRLTVLELFKIGKREFAKCLCEYGNICNPREYKVRKDNVHSCGCYQREIALNNKNRITHGMTDTTEYESWCKMKSRCYCKGNNRYYRYGERGIIVCDRWLHSFENFYEDMGKRPSKKHSIDRIDNDGNYGPSNCRWGTPLEQANNQSYHGGKGVSKGGNGYIVQMSRRKMRIYLGKFNNLDNALSFSNSFKDWFDINEYSLKEKGLNGKQISDKFINIINNGKI